jgi:hypothetical protein
VGAVSAGVLATVLVVSSSSHDGGADPTGSSSAADRNGPAPTAPGTAGLPTPPQQMRLRDIAADLCLDIRGKPEAGAGARLAACSSAGTQQWTYEDDGLLRSVAGPGLCLDSHKDAGVVILGSCADEDAERGDDVRYDLTVQGELLPRWDERLALTSTTKNPDADIVVEVRDRSAEQRWRTEPAPTTPAVSLSIAGTGGTAARPVDLSDT